MYTEPPHTATGVFPDQDQAEQAVKQLKQAGFRTEQIFVDLQVPPAADPFFENGDRNPNQCNMGFSLLGAVLGLTGGMVLSILVLGWERITRLETLWLVLICGMLGWLTGTFIASQGTAISTRKERRTDREDTKQHRVIVKVMTGRRLEDAMRILRRCETRG
jgi:hypothetical protein